MTTPSQFLATEAVLKALTEELTSVKTASEQIEDAKVSVQTLLQMSNQVISHATTASENSNQLISEFGTAQVNIKENSEVLQQKIRDIKELVEMIQNRITEIAEESKKRDEETLTTASQNSSQLLSEFGAAQVNIEEINKGLQQKLHDIKGLVEIIQN